MARIASQSKGGYYPTPLKELQLITTHLAIHSTDEAQIINALDPCCGEGHALNVLAHSLKKQGQANVTTYGIELEETRANTAQTVLDHLVNDSYEWTRTEAKYGLLWLNPPYDEIQNERLELRFLKTLTSTSKNVLLPGGLLMFCIPQYVIKHCAVILASRFKDLRMYRFTDENYPVFSQVVVFGYFRKPTLKEQREQMEMVKAWTEMDPSEVPTLEHIEEGFIVPAHSEPIKIFRAGRLNIKEVAKDLKDSPVFDEFLRKIKQSSNQAIMKNPILPLKSTHVALAVASGAVGGNLGNHIVKGVTKQTTHVQQLYNDEGVNTGKKITKYHDSAIRLFTEDGIHELN